MNRLRKILLPFFVAITCIFCFCECSVQKSENEIARDRITDLTGVEVPKKTTIVYHSREPDKFLNGRRSMYTVFAFESEPTEWLNDNSFNKEKDREFEMYFLGGFDFLPVEKEEIPKKYLPDFEENYYFLRTENNVYFVYIPQNLMLAVLIPGH